MVKVIENIALALMSLIMAIVYLAVCSGLIFGTLWLLMAFVGSIYLPIVCGILFALAIIGLVTSTAWKIFDWFRL